MAITAGSRYVRSVTSTQLRIRRLGLAVMAFALSLMVLASQAEVASAAQTRTQSRAKVKIGSGAQITREDTPEERRGQEALALIRFNWREILPGWRVVFLPARRGYLGMTYRPERRIEMYVRMDRPAKALAHDLAHELGHAVDVTFLNSDRRATYLELRGLPSDTPWWACNSCADLDTGAGDFAETFAIWAAPRYKFYGTLAPAASADTIATMAEQVFPEALGVPATTVPTPTSAPAPSE
jgi:hypothetical protein